MQHTEWALWRLRPDTSDRHRETEHSIHHSRSAIQVQLGHLYLEEPGSEDPWLHAWRVEANLHAKTDHGRSVHLVSVATHLRLAVDVNNGELYLDPHEYTDKSTQAWYLVEVPPKSYAGKQRIHTDEVRDATRYYAEALHVLQRTGRRHPADAHGHDIHVTDDERIFAGGRVPTREELQDWLD
ncbi:MAG: hypothetical protein MHM6MM_004666 [Cercozoa sp. M6MM]